MSGVVGAAGGRLAFQLVIIVVAGLLISRRFRAKGTPSPSWSAPGRSTAAVGRLVRRHLRGWLTIIGIAWLVQAAWYLLLVAVIVSTQHYSFWTEPPPTAAADRFAELALVVYFVGVIIGAAYSFGAMSAYALDVVSDRSLSAGRAFRTPALVFRRTWWWAAPLFGAAVLAMLIVFIAPIVAQWARLPPRWLTNRTRPERGASGQPEPQPWRSTMSVLGLAISATTLVSLFSVIAIVDAFDGMVELAAWLILIVGFVFASLLGSALATAGALAETT